MWQLRSETDAKVEIAAKQFLAPCQNKCPINEDIQRTNVLISLLPEDPERAREGVIQIGDYLHSTNPFFTVCGYICGICEKECNYKTKGGSIKRRLLKRFLSDTYTPYLSTKAPLDVIKDKERVAVIGGGPGGLMCAWELSKKGYVVTIFDENQKLGGALRLIPVYRLPHDILDNAIDNIVRIGDIEVKKEMKPNSGNPLEQLRRKGYKAFFVATGTPYPRPLTFGMAKVEWQGLKNVMYGLDVLKGVNTGIIDQGLFKGKNVVVIGGGNVAFDVARTVYRMGGKKVTVVCLETWDKNSKDGIPADVEEIEGAHQEGIEIIYSRGVRKIIGEKGTFKKVESPKCTSVFDEKGFNPKFDTEDVIEIEGDMLLITIGQMWDRTFLEKSELFDERGRLAVDPVTLQSMKNEDVFIGGDVRRIGFMVDAMAEGKGVAESIDRYLRGVGLQRWQIRHETTESPLRKTYKDEPKPKWTSPVKRRNFDMFEIGFTLEEAIQEARRCLECGPCLSCKACVSAGVQEQLPTIRVEEALCSGCGICVTACNYNTAHLVDVKEIIEGREVATRRVSYSDPLRCKACGQCVSACPSGARELLPEGSMMGRRKIEYEPGIVCFACRFGWIYAADELPKNVKNMIPVVCIGKVDATEIVHAFKSGAEGVLLLGCGEGDCHFQDGNQEAKKRVYLLHQLLESFGIEKERLEIVTAIDSCGKTVPGLLKSLSDRVKSFGPINIGG